jgi:hypothetical protein
MELASSMGRGRGRITYTLDIRVIDVQLGGSVPVRWFKSRNLQHSQRCR